MVSHFVGTHKHIVIDTEEYSGNFEREMVAFITGCIGECGVGEKSQAIAAEELTAKEKEWLEKNVDCWVADDNGCRRPAFIVETPGWGNDGKGTHTRKQSENPSKVNKRATKYPAYQSVGFRVHEWPDTFMTHTIIRRAQRFCKERIDIMGKPSPLTFTGIRFVERVTTEKTMRDIAEPG